MGRRSTNSTNKKASVPPSLGIIGYGIVGQALASGFHISKKRPLYRHYIYDKYKKTLPLTEVVKKSEFIFICLPTPMLDNESGIDLGIISSVIAKITPLTNNTDKIVVIKSTVVPGTTVAFAKKYPRTNFIFNPEFLTESNYLEDFVKADRTIIGAAQVKSARRLAALYRRRFPQTRIYLTDPSTAEMVKYMANTYLATKVIFANQMFDLCRKLGLNYQTVKTMVVADHRIYDSHLDVTGQRGFGGKCLPKDTVALLGLAKKIKADLTLLKTVWQINKRVRRQHDWHKIPFAVSRPKKKNQ